MAVRDAFAVQGHKDVASLTRGSGGAVDRALQNRKSPWPRSFVYIPETRTTFAAELSGFGIQCLAVVHGSAGWIGERLVKQARLELNAARV
jgi:hypothetical protein